jgi:O-antigen/teichoic acid export membrane protein
MHIIANFCIVAYFLQQYCDPRDLKNFQRSTLIPMLRSNIRYVKFTMPAEFVGSAAGLAPLLIIQAYFGAAAAGLYAMAVRIAGIPSGFIGKAIGEVFRGNLSNCKSGLGQRRLFDQSLYILVTLSIFVGILILLLNAFRGVELLFPEEWFGLMQVLLITWLLFGVKLIASPLSYTLFFFQKNNIDFYWQFLMLISLTIPLVLTPNFVSALLMQSLIGGIVYLILIYYCRSLFKS